MTPGGGLWDGTTPPVLASVGVKWRAGGAAGGGSGVREWSAHSTADFTDKSMISTSPVAPPPPATSAAAPAGKEKLATCFVLPFFSFKENPAVCCVQNAHTHTHAHKSPVCVHAYVHTAMSDIRLCQRQHATFTSLEKMLTSLIKRHNRCKPFFSMLTGMLAEMLTLLFLFVNPC